MKSTNSCLTLAVDVDAGASLEDAFAECERLKARTDLNVAFKFNGISCYYYGQSLKELRKAFHAETSPRDGFNKLMLTADETVDEMRTAEFKKVIAAALVMGNRTDIADVLARYAAKASQMGVFNKKLDLNDLRGKNAPLVVATIIEAYAYEIARKEGK